MVSDAVSHPRRLIISVNFRIILNYVKMTDLIMCLEPKIFVDSVLIDF